MSSPFVTGRERDAWATIRGYVYQVDITILRWLSLDPKNELELECGEDIDEIQKVILRNSDMPDRCLIQVKHRDSNLTLRSEEAKIALAGFYEHQSTNPKLHLAFCYITNSLIGLERPSPIPEKIPAIQAWEMIRCGELKVDLFQTVEGIKSILINTNQPKKINANTWNSWFDFISTANNDKIVEFIKCVQWNTGFGEENELSADVKEELTRLGYATSPDEAEVYYYRLFLFVFKKLSQTGIKRLNINQLHTKLSEPDVDDFDRELLSALKHLIISIEKRISNLENSFEEQQQELVNIKKKIDGLIIIPYSGHEINYSIQKPIIDVPPLIQHCVARNTSVAQCLKELKDNTWLALYGELGCGKTQLTILLIQALNACTAWMRFRSLTPVHASLYLDSVLFALSGIKPIANWSQWCNVVCDYFKNGTIVMDDLPCVNKTDEDFYHKIAVLFTVCKENNIKIISNSYYALPESFLQLVGRDHIKLQEVPRFSKDDVTELLKVHNAPASFLSRLMINFLTTITKGHPTLLTAAIQWISNRCWKISNREIEALMQGDYAEDIVSEHQELLAHTVKDTYTRELIYRLCLVGAPFSKIILERVSQVPAIISFPFEKINSAIGLWVQHDSPNLYQISPLIEPLGKRNLDEKLRCEIHLKIGESILEAKVIGPLEAMDAINHFTNAKAFNETANVLIRILTSFIETNMTKDDWGITDVWYNMPLPSEMDLNNKIIIRAIQIDACEKVGKKTHALYANLDELLTDATDEESFSVFLACMKVGPIMRSSSLPLANKYLLKCLEVKSLASKVIGQDLSIIQDSSIESIIWMNAFKIETPEHLFNWIDTLKQFNDAQLSTAISDDLMKIGCVTAVNKLWLGEYNKPENEKNWDVLYGTLNQMVEEARKLNLEYLWCWSIRLLIITASECLDKIDDAEEWANLALQERPMNNNVQFLIRDALGQQYHLKGNSSDALVWLKAALKYEIEDDFLGERILTYANIYIILSHVDFDQAAIYVKMAVDLGRDNDKVPEIYFIQSLGEYAVSLWLSKSLKIAYPIWEEAVERLLAFQEDNDFWKATFVIMAHINGYFSGLACERPPSTVGNGSEYKVPSQGMIINCKPELASLYDDQKKYLIYSQLSMFAEAIGKSDDSVKWALKGFDMAKTFNNDTIFIASGPVLISHLISKGSIEEALDVALHFTSATIAAKVLTQQGRNPIAEGFQTETALGDKPNPNWDEAERLIVIYGLLPIVLYISTVNIEDNEAAVELAKRAIYTCKQASLTASSPELWTEAGELFNEIFVNPVNQDALLKKAKDFSEAGISAFQAICYIGVSTQASLDVSFRLHLLVLHYIDNFTRIDKALSRQIVLPYIRKYWCSAFKQKRFSFFSPNLVQEELYNALDSPEDVELLKILRALNFGLNIDMSQDIKSWLNGD